MLAAFAVRGRGPIGLAKDTSNLFRDRAKASKRLLDVRAFNHVLALDNAGGWVEAEGMTSYEDLAAGTLASGVMPAVVPQLKTITLGGAAAGVGIEASSFKYGLVHESLLSMDVLTGDGRVRTCTPDNEHSDLFFGFPNSYGTLGYALKLRARTVRVKPSVELRHRRFSDAQAFFGAMNEACSTSVDFVDGVAFGRRDMVLNTGRFLDSTPYLSDYSFEKIFYRSIRERELDYLSTRDFIWRWDTDWFWCSKNVGAQVPWIRRLYGREHLGSRTFQKVMRWNSRWGITRLLDRIRGGHAESVIQDVDIPLENAAAFLDSFQREIGIAPVWTCPIRASAAAERCSLYPMRAHQLYVNFGFWDVLRRPRPMPAGHFNRVIEREVERLGGIKSLYSESYYSREQFWRTYGGEAYRALKARYDPEGNFPDLYEKCVLRC
ncbi:MAG: FAD-binding oxidoreductase [Betaproteobacteria bacterium]|nr:FAD-binding oxidoreductase [Betaproteobacteria bacterium]